MRYEEYVKVFKALADETRLKIVDMLSCGEMCACDILDYFQITQPTLSYHLKILTESGIVISRKDGAWTRYRLNEELVTSTKGFWDQLTTSKDSCICNETKKSGNCD